MGNENGKVSYIQKLPSKLDLLQSARDHFCFVQELNFNPHLFHPKVIQYAIFRYQNFWLPFAAKHIDKTLVAPVDLELIWVVHILNREAYKQDCLKIAKQLISHTMVSFERRLSNEVTKRLWEAHYADKMPLSIDHKKFPDTIPPYDSIVSINLVEAVQKYRLFCRQVSLPHYKDPKFLQTAIFTYLQEAISAEKDGLERLDKEFIWRTHRLTPNAYVIDGNMLTERYGPKIRQHHSVRNAPKSATSYDVNTTYTRGTMPRGEIVQLVSMIDQQKLTALANKTLNFHIMGYRLANLSQGKNYRLRIRTKSLLTQKETNLQTIRVKAEGSLVFQTYPDKSEDTTFTYNSACADVLQIRLSEINMTNSSVTAASQDTVDQFHFDYDFFNCEGYSIHKETKLEFSIPTAKGTTSDDDELSWIRLRCDDIKIGVINFFFGIKKSHVSNATHFCNVLCHPMLMAPYGTKRSKAPCIYVSRPLKDRRQETMYKCRVLRTITGDFFSTEIFDFNEKLICASYTAGKDILPSESQVLQPESCCVLRDKIETVFVIRSSNFDWGLLKVFHMKTKENHIVPKQMLFMNLKDVHLKWVNLYDCEEKTRVINYKLKEHRLLIDIPIGRLSIPPLVQAFPELLSLGVTVLSLFHCFPYNDTLGIDN